LSPFRHIECNTSKTPGSKRWPALAAWILEGVPTNRVGRNAFFCFSLVSSPLSQGKQRLNPADVAGYDRSQASRQLRLLDRSAIVRWTQKEGETVT
jgi:hypothetical protein